MLAFDLLSSCLKHSACWTWRFTSTWGLCYIFLKSAFKARSIEIWTWTEWRAIGLQSCVLTSGLISVLWNTDSGMYVWLYELGAGLLQILLVINRSNTAAFFSHGGACLPWPTLANCLSCAFQDCGIHETALPGLYTHCPPSCEHFLCTYPLNIYTLICILYYRFPTPLASLPEHWLIWN